MYRIVKQTLRNGETKFVVQQNWAAYGEPDWSGISPKFSTIVEAETYRDEEIGRQTVNVEVVG